MKNFILLILVTLTFLPSAFATDPYVGKLGINFHLVPHFNKPEWTWTPMKKGPGQYPDLLLIHTAA